jgi:hypothetical protein
LFFGYFIDENEPKENRKSIFTFLVLSNVEKNENSKSTNA